MAQSFITNFMRSKSSGREQVSAEQSSSGGLDVDRNIISLNILSPSVVIEGVPQTVTENPTTSTEYIGSTAKSGNFKASWVQIFPWLEYDSRLKVAFCGVCKWAAQNNKVTAATLRLLSSHPRYVWVKRGFGQFKKGTMPFAKHDKSSSHRECVSAKAASDGKDPMCVILDEKTKKKMIENRKGLNAIFDTIVLLSVQGLAFRGDTDDDSNVLMCMKSFGKHSETVRKWLEVRQSRYKWLSHSTQNEMIATLAKHALNAIVSDIKGAKLFSIMADETTDVTTKQQLSLCIRYIDADLKVHEEFLGLFDVPKADAASLFQVITNAVESLDLDLNLCRGQGYDGAAAMSGSISGVQQRFKALFPTMVYIHCSGHQLNLVIQDIFKSSTAGMNALKVLQTCVVFIKSSPKRLNSYEKFKENDPSSDYCGSLRPMCPTRWVMRAEAIFSFLENYESILNWLEEMILSDSSDALTKSQARCFLASLENFSTYFMLRTLQHLLIFVNPVHVEVQKRNITIANIRSKLDDLVCILSGNNEQKADDFFQATAVHAATIGVGQPSCPRSSGARSARLSHSNNDDSANASSYFIGMYCKIFETAVSSITKRYQSEDLLVAFRVETILVSGETLRAADVQEAISSVEYYYNNDLVSGSLMIELERFNDYVKAKSIKIFSIDDVRSVFADNDTLRLLLPNAFCLLRLFLLLPCTTCEAERSFSTLRRLKTYLRNRMTQERLNDTMLLHVHKKRVEKLNMTSIINQWIEGASMRKNTFALL